MSDKILLTEFWHREQEAKQYVLLSDYVKLSEEIDKLKNVLAVYEKALKSCNEILYGLTIEASVATICEDDIGHITNINENALSEGRGIMGDKG